MEVYREEYSRGLITCAILHEHICDTSIIFSCILNKNFQNPTRWIFDFFSYSFRSGLIQLSLNSPPQEDQNDTRFKY